MKTNLRDNKYSFCRTADKNAKEKITHKKSCNKDFCVYFFSIVSSFMFSEISSSRLSPMSKSFSINILYAL